MLYKLVKMVCECSITLPTVSDADHPPLFDVRGGEKRRGLRDDEENPLGLDQELPEQVQETSEGEPESSGSLALGGEPEDREPNRESNDFERRGSTQPPIRSPAEGLFGPALGSSFGQTSSSNIGSIAGSRAITPQQQAYIRAQAAFPDHLPPGITPTQSALFPNQGHNRQGSRFSFANANDNQSQSTSVKLAANPRIMAQQSSMMPSTFASQPGSQFYPSTMPGPPPGLKSTGTPPSMFGQNHGFGGSGFGGAPKDTNELLQNLIRGRGAASQAHDAGKREYMFSTYPNQYPPSSTSSTPAPAPNPASGLLAPLYGNQPGAFPDYGSKQKKKGKKHRHANTSSSGGSGLVDLVDPSILQASRMQQHQQQSNAGVAQGLFGGQSQGGYTQNMMYGGTAGYGRWT
jgi:CCR4-NOT transcription complex subunit 4